MYCPIKIIQMGHQIIQMGHHIICTTFYPMYSALSVFFPFGTGKVPLPLTSHFMTMLYIYHPILYHIFFVTYHPPVSIDYNDFNYQ